MIRRSTDYVLVETNRVYWGVLRYRSNLSQRGYPTREAAINRAYAIVNWAKQFSCRQPNFQVIERAPEGTRIAWSPI